MKVERFSIKDVVLFTPKKLGDSRGFFMETFKQDFMDEALGKRVVFVQENHSQSNAAFTLRGLHFQSPPMAQAKLIRCTKGEMLDVVVDVRKGSRTYGKHLKASLTAENGAQLYVPAGFLHGFVTLRENTEVQYKCTDYYSQDYEGTVFWNDEDLGIDWGVTPESAILSDRDSVAPRLKDISLPF